MNNKHTAMPRTGTKEFTVHNRPARKPEHNPFTISELALIGVVVLVISFGAICLTICGVEIVWGWLK